MNDIMKIIKSLKDAGLFNKGGSETVVNEAKKQKVGFLSMLLCALGARLLGNLLTGKGVKHSKIPGRGVIRAGKWAMRSDQDFNAALSFN